MLEKIKIHKNKNGDQRAVFSSSYPLNKPRDHSLAIAIELLGKSIINEFEKYKYPDNIPDVAKYLHNFIKIHRQVKNISRYLDFSENKFEFVDEVILEKLYVVIKWGSRYHYDGNPENHIRKVTFENPNIIGPETNPSLTDGEFFILVRLFCEYSELHKTITKMNDFFIKYLSKTMILSKI